MPPAHFVARRGAARTAEPRTASPPSGRGTRRLIESIVHLDRVLRAGACHPLARLADDLDASPRTVQRYLEFLRDRLHAPVIYDRVAKGYRYTRDAVAIPAAHLTEGELVALYVAEPILARYRGTPLEAHFQSAFEKITASLPERVKSRFAALPSRVSAKGALPTGDHTERFRQLLSAVLDERVVELRYYSAYRDGESERRVDPYAIHNVEGAWYVIGYCHTRRRILSFHLARIRELRVTESYFERPDDFRVDRFLANAFGIYLDPTPAAAPEPIVVRCDSFAARYIREAIWHPSQQLTELSDGSIDLTLRLSGTVEIERFVLSWGEHVQVVAPAALRRKLRDRLRAAARQYVPRNAPARSKAAAPASDHELPLD